MQRMSQKKKKREKKLLCQHKFITKKPSWLLKHARVLAVTTAGTCRMY